MKLRLMQWRMVGATAAKHPFDPRWTLFFTPHSARVEPGLIAQARGAWWWNEPWLVGRRQIPFGFGWLKDGKNPYRELLREQLTRVLAIAARHHGTPRDGAKELHCIAQWLADQWTPENEKLLNP